MVIPITVKEVTFIIHLSLVKYVKNNSGTKENP